MTVYHIYLAPQTSIANVCHQRFDLVFLFSSQR